MILNVNHLRARIPRGRPPEHRLSVTEFDLVSRLNMSLRKNLKEGVYEIVGLDSGDVLYAYERLADAASKANELEGTDFIKLHCGPFCPKRGTGYL